MKQYMLSTIDNPYDPFTQFDEWYAYDETKGYHSCSLLAKFAHPSDVLSEVDNVETIKQAIDQVIELNELQIEALLNSKEIETIYLPIYVKKTKEIVGDYENDSDSIE